jgi:hypothetical protein
MIAKTNVQEAAILYIVYGYTIPLDILTAYRFYFERLFGCGVNFKK